ARLDAVGDHRMARAVQTGSATDYETVAAYAVDIRAHRNKALRQIRNLGFARGIDQHGLAFREGGRHQEVFGGADRHTRKDNLGTAQPFRSARLDIALAQFDFGPEPL